MRTQAYQDDVGPEEAWQALSESDAVLVDVRTRAEWAYVGLPDLSSLGRQLFLAEWQSFPTQQVDPDFAGKLVAALGEAGVGQDVPLYFICRSGVRSAAAAAAMTAAGYGPCFNVSGGFEGDRDEAGHRGQINGWKAVGLPWTQS
ncbi:rhodanese-related sulfurtransferase [Rhodopseudomonas julia]|uniref:Rhodanese-related sulfurtransferase n=1 Tax=Rhodopseudomonas julia TaxID=200617 RepID=A0ABU0C5N3_9BRAD|nr:rhodanese-like domain-containing protein [Rhodopseudomonas julia]MDQ0325826.1 rhodanese-related sulfurtransferase [Rhodopseudomonas julia]